MSWLEKTREFFNPALCSAVAVQACLFLSSLVLSFSIHRSCAHLQPLDTNNQDLISATSWGGPKPLFKHSCSMQITISTPFLPPPLPFVTLQQPPQYACGCLFLLSEVLKARPPLWNMVLQNESVNDDDDEHFEDIVEDTENKATIESEKPDNDNGEVADIKDNDNGDSSGDEGVSPNSGSEDEGSDGDNLLMGDDLNGPHKNKTMPDHSGPQRQIANVKPSLPGGYDPRHREPSYCNADCVNWWELMVLASHVHPSVATMAKTLLSGANIVYNGNPLHDLSLTAFLDKLMEKKPKQSTWYGGSQIEPAKKPDMNNQLIAEMDVPPEDLVFHKFYMSKMNSSKKPKKKKKKMADDEAAEELFAGNGDDASDNEEIDNMLDSVNPSLEADDDYGYDDLDKIANEDDEDLVANASEEEDEAMDFPSDIDIAEGDDDGDDIVIGDGDDGSDEDIFDKNKKKRKSSGRKGASPFVSLDDYEHLLNEESPTKHKFVEGKKPKIKRKRKTSE